MKDNPYSLVFGKSPNQMIARPVLSEEILSSFLSESPSKQLFMITGIRGAGKTVLMTEVSKTIGANPDWIVIELNPERDMLTALASKLSSENALAAVFQEAKINLSFFGFGVEIAGTKPITDIETALSKMLGSLKKRNKRVLITIDEVSNTREMRVFAAAYQIFVRQDLPLFLLMTGLHENIRNLQNEKSLTFLYRAPTIELGPLNVRSIARNYKKNLPVTEEEAMQLARMTKGYSFAFQVLGYYIYEKQEISDAAIWAYREYLEAYVYEKVWEELSPNDQKTAYGIAKTPSGKISEVRAFLNMETNQFNPYRKRLIRKGVIEGEQYGYVHFVLPFFEEFVRESYEQTV